MTSSRSWWNDLSISKKLYAIFGVMAVLILCELLTLQFAMRTISAVRAFVGGEAIWSKRQKNALIALEQYGLTHDEYEYREFLDFLKAEEGAHGVRLELQQAKPDLESLRSGLREAGIHPDDIDNLVALLTRFRRNDILVRATQIWAEADELISRIKTMGVELHERFLSNRVSQEEIQAKVTQVHLLNRRLTVLEERFSALLGEGSRRLERFILLLLSLAVISVEGIGLSLVLLTSRRISNGLTDLGIAADRIGRGGFGYRTEVRSNDEIGQLKGIVNRMGEMLEKSYNELESRIQERTARLADVAKENARLYEDARNAIQVRDEFLSVASHELKTPLSSLSLQLQLLSRMLEAGTDSSPRADVAELANRSVRQSKRLSFLIDQLMDLTRLRAGKLELRIERCDLAAVVRDAVVQLGVDAARAGSMISFQAAAPVIGQFDASRMGQVCGNLLSNAIKYGQGKPISVTVEARGEKALVVVQDQGLGIGASQLSRIFERFERAVTTDTIPGLGLGLYISRQIVEAHHGSIHVESEPGAGSKFTVELPLETR